MVTLQDILETLKDLDSQILDKLEDEGASAKEIDESATNKNERRRFCMGHPLRYCINHMLVSLIITCELINY